MEYVKANSPAKMVKGKDYFVQSQPRVVEHSAMKFVMDDKGDTEWKEGEEAIEFFSSSPSSSLPQKSKLGSKKKPALMKNPKKQVVHTHDKEVGGYETGQEDFTRPPKNSLEEEVT